MKKLLIAIPILLGALTLTAQTTDGTSTYNKQKQPAIVVQYDYAADAVKNAFIKRMEELGNKSTTESGLFNKDKGVIVFKNATVKDISELNYDYIVNVDSKRGDKSVLYFMIDKDGSTAIPGMDSNAMERAKTFINSLSPNVGDANLELQIKSQEEVVLKSEKKYKSLTDDRADMEKKIANLQKDLEKNKKDMEDQQKESETQRQSLDILKGKRRTTN